MTQALAMQMIQTGEPPNTEYTEAESLQIAEYVTRQREALLDALEDSIHAHAESYRGTWLNVFCAVCDEIEVIRGTARQLAEKVLALGWVVENGKPVCAKCVTQQEAKQ